MSTVKKIDIRRVIPENLEVQHKQIHIGAGFWDMFRIQAAEQSNQHPIYYLFDHYLNLDSYVRPLVTPFDKTGKLQYQHLDMKITDGGLVSYIPNEKGLHDVYDLSSNTLYNLSVRQTMKVGKFIKSFFDPKLLTRAGVGDADIERFSSFVKSKMNFDDFEYTIVQGDEIKWAYRERNYLTIDMPGGSATSSLTGSCMRYDKCQPWFDLYTTDDRVKMVILKHKPTGKVAARALLWHNLPFKNGFASPIDINFMDRVYAYREWMIPALLDWASKNGYYKKKKQSIEEKISLITPAGQEVDGTITLKIAKPLEFYPYMDTFTYMKSDHVTLSNNQRDERYKLTDYNYGNASAGLQTNTACYRCSTRVPSETITVIGSRNICTTCREEHYVFSDHHNTYIPESDSTLIDLLGYVYDHETVWDAQSDSHILSSSAVEVRDHDGSWCWTHVDNSVTATNGEDYLVGHPSLVMIDGDYYHVDDTFVCAHDGVRYNTDDVLVEHINGVFVNTYNLDAYMDANNLMYDVAGDVVRRPELELVEAIAEPVAIATTTPPRAPRRRLTPAT